MKTLTKQFTLTGNKKDGSNVESETGNLLATTSTGDKVWFPAKAAMDKCITYAIHEKGDTFKATSDSSQTKLEVLGKEAVAALAKERKTEKPEDIKLIGEEPLFSEGETVTRLKPSIEWIGFAPAELKSEEEELSLFAKKAQILAGLGVKVSI